MAGMRFMRREKRRPARDENETARFLGKNGGNRPEIQKNWALFGPFCPLFGPFDPRFVRLLAGWRAMRGRSESAQKRIQTPA